MDPLILLIIGVVAIVVVVIIIIQTIGRLLRQRECHSDDVASLILCLLHREAHFELVGTRREDGILRINVGEVVV